MSEDADRSPASPALPGSSGSPALPTQREVALVEVLDRALGAGVVITGDITLSLADIDLVYVSLRLLVGSQPLFAESHEP